MTRAAIIHPSLNKMEDAEKILLETLRGLNEEGYETVLYTIDRVNWEKLESKWGPKTRPAREVSYIKELKQSNALDWFVSTILYLWILWRSQQEQGISLNNYGEFFPFFSDLSYTHNKPFYINRDHNAFNLPFWPYSWKIVKYLYSKLSNRLSKIIVANSGYTAGLLEQAGIRSIVVYPFIEPIKLKAYKKGEVLTISTITWGKNLDTLFNVAAMCQGVKFLIAGSVSPNALDLVKEIKRSNRFSFYANPSRQDIEKYMSESSVYFSIQPNETFGISIVEAMSMGCVPLVNRDGGPWYDILRAEEKVGLSYETEEEAAEKVRKVLTDEDLRNSLRVAAVERSKEFTVERFRKDIIPVIKSIEPRDRKDGGLVNLCRWVEEKREKYGF